MSFRASIIIPVHNRAETLEHALRSVCAQTLPAFETIVIDDGSTDGTADAARGFSDRMNRLRLIEQPNAGPGAARNRGIELAKGDWLVFLDSDDRFHAEKLEAFAAAAAHGADFIHSDRSYQFPDGSGRARSNYQAERMREKPFLFSGFFVKTSTVAAARTLVERTGARFAEDLRTCEDYQFFWSALGDASSIAYIERPLTRIAETPGSLTRRDNSSEILRDNVLMTTRMIDRTSSEELSERLRSLRYRCAQSMLLQSRREPKLLWDRYKFIARFVGHRKASQALTSALLST